jgi:hypothetical protein
VNRVRAKFLIWAAMGFRKEGVQGTRVNDGTLYGEVGQTVGTEWPGQWLMK